MADQLKALRARKAEWEQYLDSMEELGKTVGQSVKYIRFDKQTARELYGMEDEFSKLVLDNAQEWFRYWGKYNWKRYRADPIWIELCQVLFDVSCYTIDTLWVPFNKRPKLWLESVGEIVTLRETNEYYDPVVCTNPMEVTDFIYKFQLVRNNLKALHKQLRLKWIESAPTIFKHAGIKTFDLYNGYYFLEESAVELFRAQPDGYYIDKIQKILDAIERLPISLIQKCCDIYGNDPYLFDQLIILDGLVMSGAKLDDIVL
jgi:hypothetical protein